MNPGSRSTNPFPGLRAFRQDEDYLFFGREEQTIELLQRLCSNRFVAVVGTSGSGKSSLVRCGLLSELLGGKMRQAGASWEVAVTHPGGNPLALLTNALLEADLYDAEEANARENLLATLSRSHFGLVEAVRQAGLGEGTNFLLVVDQFEELFRFREAGRTQQEAAAEFVSLLLETVAQNEVPIYVVLTMRSDFIGECSQFDGLAEMVNRGEFLIPRLTREQYKRVIEGPVKVAGGKIAPRLLQRLLNDLGQQADQLPCLQHALMRTWEVWAAAADREALDLDDYQRVGRMAEALSLHADEVYEALPGEREREWCRGIFEALTVKESENRGIRRPQRLGALGEILDVPVGNLVPIIDAYRHQGVTFLMPSPEVELRGETIIDISHESLMRVWVRLRRWVEEEAQAAGIYRRLAESAVLHGEGKAGLYRDPELGIALAWLRRARHANRAWAERYRSGFDEAMGFLDASQKAADDEERAKEAARQRELDQANALAEAERRRAEEQRRGASRLRKLLVAAAVVALLAVAASVFAILQTRKAEKSETAAANLSSQLKTRLVQGDFDNSFEKLESGEAAASLAYLARAMRTNPDYAPAGVRALSTLTSGRLPVQRFAPIEHPKPIGPDYLHNGKHDVLVAASEEGRDVRLWDLETGAQRAVLHNALQDAIGGLDPSPAAPALVARVPGDFAAARSIWLAADPDEPPSEPRYFRKSIALPEGRVPVRADFFIEADDAFELSVNGKPIAMGEGWSTTFHTGVFAEILRDGLDVVIMARNDRGVARLMAAVIIAFEESEPLLITTDASWQSSTAPEGEFVDSREFSPRAEAGSVIREATQPPIRNLAFSADEERVLGLGLGTPMFSTDDGPSTTVRFLNRMSDEVSVFWLDRKGDRKPYGKIAPGGETTQTTVVGHVFLVADKEDQPILVVRATVEAIDAVIDGKAGPVDPGRGNAIIAWDVRTGERVGPSLAMPADLKGFRVVPIDGPDDLVGCEFTGDGALQIWNRTTGLASTPRLKTGGKVIRWEFSPDGRRIIGLFADSAIGVWDVTSGTELARINTRPVRAARFSVSHDGRWILALDEPGNQAAWWELGALGGAGVAEWITLPFAAEEARFLASGDVVAFLGTGENGTVRARSFALGGERPQVADITSNRNAARMAYGANPANRSYGIVGALTGNLITLWDLHTGEPFPRPLLAPELLVSANLAPDGRRLIAGSATEGASAGALQADKKLFVFDVFNGSLEFPRPIVLRSAAAIFFSPDGETLVTSDEGAKRVQFWDLRTGREVRTPIPATCRQVLFSNSGERVAIYQYSRTSRGERDLGQSTGRFLLHAFGIPPAAPEYLVERAQRWPIVSAPAAGGRWLTYDWPATAPNPRLQVWAVAKEAPERTVDLVVDTKARNGYSTIKWSAEADRMILINGEKSAAIVETDSGKVVHEFRSEELIAVVAISRDGATAACGMADGSVSLWTEDGGLVESNPFSEKDGIGELGFNASGSLLGVGQSTKRIIAIIDSRSGQARFEPRPTVNGCDGFAFTPDGRHVIVSALDSKIPMIDLQSGEVVREFEIADWSRRIDLSEDGRILAVAAGANLSATSGETYLIDVESGRMLTPPLRHGGSVLNVKLSSDGTMLATGTFQTPGGFGYFQLWDVATGLPLTDPVAERGYVISIAIQPDGGAVAAGWTNGVVQTLRVPPRRTVPGWFPDVAEAIAGRRLAAETGAMEDVPDGELAAVRERVLAGDPGMAADPDWFTWARWLFEAPDDRAVSPGATTMVERLVARFRAADNIEDLHQAVRLSPTDAPTFARLATLYQAMAPKDSGPVKRHWEDSAVWFSDRAIALEPANPEVWTMRGDLMRKLGRIDSAAEAASKVLALAPANGETSSPNALYQNAMALAAEDKWEEAQKAYDGALDRLDDYLKQLESGEQPLPLLGNLGRLVPRRVSSATAGAPGRTAGSDAGTLSSEPIAGAFENFNAVNPGGLPPGWRIWNDSYPGDRPGVRSMVAFNSDTWGDWAVIDRKQLDWGNDSVRKRILREGSQKRAEVDGVEVPLLDGRFALAIGESRKGEQIQYLESPDFDCSTAMGVHLAFDSAYEHHALRMGSVEYSLDGGASWKPVVYFVHKPFLDEAKSKAGAREGNGADPGFDVAAFLDAERKGFPWRPKPGGAARRSDYGAFTVPADTPGLADCFEGRREGQTEYKKREVFALPQAAGAASVRIRFGSISSGGGYWGIDNVGLYESAEDSGAAASVASADPPADSTRQGLERPANDAQELTNLAMEFLSGKKAATGEVPDTMPLMATAMAAMAPKAAAPGAPVGTGSANTGAMPDTGAVLESRLLIARARRLEPANREARVASALMELMALVKFGQDEEAARREAPPLFERAQKILSDSNDLEADLGDPMWRQVFTLITVLRGGIAAQASGDIQGVMPLVAFARTMDPEGPAAALSAQMVASIEAGPDAAPPTPDSDLLLKRGSDWGYFDEGKLPDPGWMQPDFVDRLWFRGQASFGYGDDPKTTVGWGPDEKRKFTTTYFRSRFEVEEPEKVGSLVIRLQRDDGAVVYLNGEEVLRDNMPEGEVRFETFAKETVSDKDEKRFFDHPVGSSLLRKGENVIAVEIHQKDLTSSDIGFDLEIAARNATEPKPVAEPEIVPAVFVEKFKSFGIPDRIQVAFWNRRAEQLAGAGDLVQATLALAEADALGAGDETDPGRIRIRALIATRDGSADEADRLYGAAMDGMLQKAEEGRSIELGPLPPALREASLVRRQEPADIGFLLRRLASEGLSDTEFELALRWVRAKIGDDPDGLAQVWAGLTEGLKRDQEALDIAEAVLASVPEPKAGAPADAIRRYKEWLTRKERGLRARGDGPAADALVAAIKASPARDPAIGAKLIDLGAYFNAGLYDGTGWSHRPVTNLARLPETFTPLKGVRYDLRGIVHLGGTTGDRLRFPGEMVGIPIAQSSAAIHFLTSTFVLEPGAVATLKGREIARFVIHYDDDSSVNVPVVFSKDVADWWVATFAAPVDPAQVGWRGTNSEADPIELSELVWTNPHPGKSITTIDFISTGSSTAPFLVGITLE